MDLTHGEFVGTPNFASPEQFESAPVDVRSDIYSLGATLWFALTGKTPFAGRNLEEIRRAQKSDALPVEQLKAARVPPSLRSLLESRSEETRASTSPVLGSRATTAPRWLPSAFSAAACAVALTVSSRLAPVWSLPVRMSLTRR